MTGTEVEVRSGGALAVAADQTRWAPEQRAALASAGVSEEVSEAELSVFLHECQRTGLDPFSRQIYLIGRNDKQAGRKVFRSQTGIDGYRVVAHRAARRDHVKLGYADTLWTGPDGVWREVWVWDKPPLAAKVTVFRDGEPFPGIATLAEYAEMWDGKLKGMWARMPANQLAKCAESLALRKAFPNDLGGIYTAEEMGQADNEQQPDVEPTPLREPVPHRPKGAATRSSTADPADWETPAPEASDAVVMVSDGQLKAVHALIAAKSGPKTDEERHAGFSKFTGREITSAKQLTYDEASNLIAALAKTPNYVAPGQEPYDMGAAIIREHAKGSQYDELLDAIRSSDDDGLNGLMSQATEARDAGLILPEHWEALSNAANGRAQELVAAMAGQPRQSGWSHQQMAEAGLTP